MLQKQIYNSTKKHKLKYVNDLQKYLINSSEAKILSIKNTLDKILSSYIKLEDSKFYINIIRDLNIIKVLFNNHFLNYQIIKIIIEVVKQNLVYLLLEPFQEAKIKKDISKKLSIVGDYTYLFIDYLIDYFKYMQMNKDLLIDTIILKLQVPQYIAKLIRNWLCSGYIVVNIKLFNLDTSNSINKNNSSCNHIYKLINEMALANAISNTLCLDVIWFVFILFIEINHITTFIKIFNNKYKISITNTNFRDYHISVQACICNIKLNQYTKISLFKYPSTIINNICDIYYQYCNNHRAFISLYLISNYNKYCNIFMYNLQRKRHFKDIVIKQLKMLNYNINLYIHRHNINNYYINI
uniref:Reverse transcriptase N-terminal domain-containing protein n=1 Tax=Chondria sp. (in: red algae) TaxID=1982705 RepID=A0A1Z1MRA8_9FLOR|nr:hypothetical protein [Chondria sp. (in: red algae)]